MAAVPALHRAFLDTALPVLAGDLRVVGVAAGGSLLAGAMDEFSDLDLVIAVEPDCYDDVRAGRIAIARTLGPLIEAFTGEHVGEPRLVICLYGPPLLHVDLKFVALDDLGDRVENPVILVDRGGRLAAALIETSGGAPRFPPPDPQWIEDRMWIWVHYAAGKLGRGELFEALDFLAALRERVLGPLILARAGARPIGVRRIEEHAPDAARALEATIATRDRGSIARALRAVIAMYQELRGGVANHAAERAAVAYLDDVEARFC